MLAAAGLALAATGIIFVLLSSGGNGATPMTGATLAASLTDEIGAGDTGDDGECKRRRDGWRCNVADPGGSTFAVYDVSAISETCWQARLRRVGERAPETASGCVD
jgi:hypothetical protein